MRLWWKRYGPYTSVSSFDSESLLEQEGSNKENIQRVNQNCHRSHFLADASLLILGLITVGLSICLYRQKNFTDLQCAIQNSVYCMIICPSNKQALIIVAKIMTAPINEAIEFEKLDLYNPFYTETPYRGPPTVELEEAWEDLWVCKTCRSSNISFANSFSW
jgi:hypothetical protein